MVSPSDNEEWLIEVAAKHVIEKKVQVGVKGLTQFETLIYCLWVADYGMQNAGDLDTANDLYPDFQSVGRRAAEALSLPKNIELFSLTKERLEQVYFERFDTICDEIRGSQDCSF